MIPLLLRQLPPETAHRAAIAALKATPLLGPPAPHPRLNVALAGLSLPHPIGLAAGFDKNAEVPDAMLGLGFGFVECGTVTPRPQAGNPTPRVFRLPEDRAVINRLGFNNDGLTLFVRRLAARAQRGGIVGANIGANKDSANRIADYERGLTEVWPHCAYVTVNISSPNTPGLRGLQDRGALEELLAAIMATRQSLASRGAARPIFLKVAPDLDEDAIAAIAETALAFSLDGLIVSNTTIARPADLRSDHRAESGGLSGAPLFARSTEVLRRFFMLLGHRLPLIGVGGVATGAQAYAKIKAGARAIQLYTAMIYQGPSIARRLVGEVDACLAKDGLNSIADAIGAEALTA